MGKEQFSGDVIVRWPSDEPRNVELLKTITFTDSKGLERIADAGAIIDGASIPKFLWGFIGSPFVGMYRRASVFHDIYCKTKAMPAQATHDMFYEVMLADGVDPDKAHTMYQAVDSFGPRW